MKIADNIQQLYKLFFDDGCEIDRCLYGPTITWVYVKLKKGPVLWCVVLEPFII